MRKSADWNIRWIGCICVLMHRQPVLWLVVIHLRHTTNALRRCLLEEGFLVRKLTRNRAGRVLGSLTLVTALAVTGCTPEEIEEEVPDVTDVTVSERSEEHTSELQSR